MIELLVVISIIALLTTLVVTGANSALDAAKRRNTQQVMQNTLAALEIFSSERPLGSIYDRGENPSFGAFPPFHPAEADRALTGWPRRGPDYLSQLLAVSPSGDPRMQSLSDRIAWDLSGQAPNPRNFNGGVPNKGRYVAFGYENDGTGDADRQPNDGDGHDDIRGLSAYLTAFSPRALEAIPPDALRPIDPLRPDRINPLGGTTKPGEARSTWREVLGIHDGWGVPLDYFLYVKVGVGLRDGGRTVDFKILDRRPVLRSRGMTREIYDEWTKSPAASLNDPGRWLYSEPMPAPALTDSDIDRDGKLNRSDLSRFRTGWVRLAADENPEDDDDALPADEYQLIPAYDPRP
jgi:type II secretory pathway pseudopilin PulG